MTATVIHGDCLEALKLMEADSVESIVSDPPAGIAFMGKSWDTDKGGRQAWVAWMESVAIECLRVLKPGGCALVWALPRTSHWTGWAWENAGWEPRDKLVHLFGSGFPKSLDVSKAIDKAAGAEREVVGVKPIAYPDSNCWGIPNKNSQGGKIFGQDSALPIGDGTVAGGTILTAPSTDAAKQWSGWGTALKPAAEDWWLFRKPLSEGTVAANVLKHGTGGINIDGCRIGYASEADKASATPQGVCTSHDGTSIGAKPNIGQSKSHETFERPEQQGRWPANVILDEWQDPVLVLRDSRLEAVFRGYFVHHDSVRNVWCPSRHPAVAAEASAVLQSCLLREVALRESERRESSYARSETPTGVDHEDANFATGARQERPGGGQLAGREVPQSGLRDGVPLAPYGEETGLGASDDGKGSGLSTGASVGRGDATSQTSALGRSGPSSERAQDGQPIGESGTIGSRDAQAGALAGREGAARGTGDDRRSSFQVAESDVLSLWRGHFVESERSIRCGAAALLDEQTGERPSTLSRKGVSGPNPSAVVKPGEGWGMSGGGIVYGDSGGASRFFYTAKASRSERTHGGTVENKHPTVKAISLMRYLVRLITPPNGTVLDPFTGSGSTGVGAILEGFNFVGCEMEIESVETARERLKTATLVVTGGIKNPWEDGPEVAAPASASPAASEPTSLESLFDFDG